MCRITLGHVGTRTTVRDPWVDKDDWIYVYKAVDVPTVVSTFLSHPTIIAIIIKLLASSPRNDVLGSSKHHRPCKKVYSKSFATRDAVRKQNGP